MSTANNIAKYLKWIAGNESEISEDYHKKGYEEGKSEAENVTVALIERTVTEIEIPEGVTVIGQGAFMGCKSVTRVDIPEGVITINAQGFRDCENLKEINFPQSLKYLYNEAVMNCYRLKKLIFPPKVTKIPITCASSCWNMTEVICEGDIVYVSSNSFQYCNKCKKYDFTNCTSVPVLQNTNAFVNIPSYCKILVPAALYDAWIVATNWAQYADYIIVAVMASDVFVPDYISEGLFFSEAFNGEYALLSGIGACTDTYVVIPSEWNNLTCTTIEGIKFGNGYSEKADVSHITGVKVPSSVNDISMVAFEGCTSLKTLDFTDHTEIPYLGGMAFEEVEGMKILVPASLFREWRAATNWSYYADKIYAVI